MQYNGGKTLTLSRHGMSDFWRAYLASMQVKRFVDVCCGSGAVSSFIGKERPDIALVCNDVHPAAVALLRGVAREGWNPPVNLEEEEYKALQAQAKMGDASALIGFAGFGCSFGGKYFGGYARQKGYNFAQGAARVLKRDAAHLARADFYNLDYAALVDAVGVREGDVWYVDPPYAGTTGYAGTPKFDHVRFWAWAADLAQRVPVLVSEFAAPPEWTELWSVKRHIVLSGGINAASTKRFDCVFTLQAREWDAHLEREEAA